MFERITLLGPCPTSTAKTTAMPTFFHHSLHSLSPFAAASTASFLQRYMSRSSCCSFGSTNMGWIGLTPWSPSHSSCCIASAFFISWTLTCITETQGTNIENPLCTPLHCPAQWCFGPFLSFLPGESLTATQNCFGSNNGVLGPASQKTTLLSHWSHLHNYNTKLCSLPSSCWATSCSA